MSTVYDALMTRYRESLARYTDNPPQSSAYSSLDDELRFYERAILESPPPGMGRGLVEHSQSGRDHTAMLTLPSLADVFRTIPETQWEDKIAEKDATRLRPFVHTVLSQGGVGSCASEAKDGTIMICREIAGRKRVIMNPYFTYGRVNGGSDRGSSLSDNLAFAMEHGAVDEKVWPRSKGWRARPSDEAYANAKRHRIKKAVRIRNKLEFGTGLLDGITLYWGYSGHSIVGVDPMDRRRFRYLNSWDVSWGDGGFGTVSYDDIMWSYGAWGILSVTAPDDEV